MRFFLCRARAFPVWASWILPISLGFAQPYGLTQRPSVSAYLDGVMPATPPTLDTNWSTVVAFPNLTFLNPLGILPMPGTNKLAVWEREGRVYSFDNNQNSSTKTLVLDLHNQCQGWDDSGLLGLAFHPDFANNHYVYVWYNWVPPGTVVGDPNTRPPNGTTSHQRLARYTIDPATGVADPASEYIIIDQTDHNTWHNGGGMFFHPTNGFLYLTNGNDANGVNDQTVTRGFFGCVLRIDVDKRGGNISHPPTKRAFEEVGPNWPQSYYVPDDNPFVGVNGALEEIYSLGLRSPHRMTIDPVTGRIFIGEVGEGTWEEIDTIEPSDPSGLNYQWHTIEGYNGDLAQPYIGVNRRPLLAYRHGADGFAAIGGYVYRGPSFPELTGKYLFADNVSNRIWVMDESTVTASTPASKTLIATLPKGSGPNSGADYVGISSWGYDANGELYLCQLSSLGGFIYKLQRGGPPPGTPLPATLSQTGVFSNLATLAPSSKLIPYALNQPFWSDGAVKTRWATVPNGTTVGFKATGEWTWPAGSVLVKHFELPVDDANPAVHKRLETRLLVKTASGAVYGASYKWRADNSDADLMDSALTENIAIATPPAGNFTGVDIGAPAQAGSTSRAGDQLTIQAGGADIWNTSDQFHFAHQQRTGDFDVFVRIESLTQADLYAKAGLMARESLAPGSRHVLALAFPSNAARNNNVGGYEFQYRAATDGITVAIYPQAPQPRVSYPNTWLRLRREGDTFIGYSSPDGVSWSEFARQPLALPSTLYFGLAATAHTTSATTTAKIHLQNTRLQPWYFPSRADCMTCHTSAAGGVLGPKTRQLNGDLLYPNGATDNQIRSWAHAGLFDSPPPEDQIPALDRLVALNDPDASLEKRARSYLDSNCASCHRPGGVNALWDARFDTPLAQQGLIYGPLTNNLGDPQGRVITPQSTLHSILFRRLSTVGGGIQMPPLAKNMLDKASIAVLESWINSLPANPPPAVALTAPTTGSVFLQTDMPVTLQATASDGDGIRKVEFYDGDTNVGEDTTAPYQCDWFATWLGAHTLTAIATDNTGNNAVSSSVPVSVQGALLPAPIDQLDIGSVSVAGTGTYSGGTFTLSGSGADIWDAADAFHFIYRPLTGDGEVIVRVASMENVHEWSKVGAMMRDTLDPGSRYAFSLVTPSNGATYQMRTATNAGATEAARDASITAPQWLRMVRSGNSFSAYRSADGAGWTQIGAAQTIAMGATIYAGVAATSHDDTKSMQAVVDNVTFINTGAQTYSAKIDFQPASSPVPGGYQADTGAVFGVRPSGLSFGWNADKASATVARTNGPDARYNTLIQMGNSGSGSAVWELQLPNARYDVRIVAGDPTFPNGTQHLTAEGQTFFNAATSAATPFIDVTKSVAVTDGRLTVGLGASASNPKICFIEVSSYAVAANIAPTVALTSPFTGAAFGNPASIPVKAAATDPDSAITRVEFLVDDVQVGQDTTSPYAFDWVSPAIGTHAVAARAIDAAGGSRTSISATVTVKVQNDPPTVTFTSPASGFANLSTDSLTLSADAADGDGWIARVEFWADNAKLGEVTSPPYSWNWAGPLPAGDHILRATAVDNAGATTNSAEVVVKTLPLELKVESIDLPPGSGNVSFHSHATIPAGRTYVFEWSSDLIHWTSLQSGVSDGQLLELTDTASQVRTRFYRIRITN